MVCVAPASKFVLAAGREFTQPRAQIRLMSNSSLKTGREVDDPGEGESDEKARREGLQPDVHRARSPPAGVSGDDQREQDLREQRIL